MRTHFSFGQKLLSYILVFALTITGILAKDTIKGATTVQAAQTPNNAFQKVDIKELQEALATTALNYVGYGYEWGKNGSNGTFDCTGLVETLTVTAWDGTGEEPKGYDMIMRTYANTTEYEENAKPGSIFVEREGNNGLQRTVYSLTFSKTKNICWSYTMPCIRIRRRQRVYSLM